MLTKKMGNKSYNKKDFSLVSITNGDLSSPHELHLWYGGTSGWDFNLIPVWNGYVLPGGI